MVGGWEMEWVTSRIEEVEEVTDLRKEWKRGSYWKVSQRESADANGQTSE